MENPITRLHIPNVAIYKSKWPSPAQIMPKEYK
ncbi:hypothetical protein SAMN05216496_2539 [Pseudomonas sp. Z003-0.4C(8344-21)]|nr:hypothetical protein SAMN05216496_2539 [Pseudomonas sp. Z003-0.4C(8344-21)]